MRRRKFKSTTTVTDEVTGKKRWFVTYDEASAFAKKEYEKAKQNYEQHQDRFYVKNAGETYSVGE